MAIDRQTDRQTMKSVAPFLGLYCSINRYLFDKLILKMRENARNFLKDLPDCNFTPMSWV
jgi:hypothetical protein